MSTQSHVSRFAPSTTGDAHPGTLASALLVWLDARAAGGRALLRLEDLETSRTTPAWATAMCEALTWLGLDWDDVTVQSERAEAHARALDQLARDGRLYACTCSRKDREGGRRAPDGGWAYANVCRARVVSAWRASPDIIRARLDDDHVVPVDDGGRDLAQTPAISMGDPIVRRRDGSIAYQLAVVIDDADAEITHVVRGHDIAPSTATQVMLQRLLAVPTPRYRHHLLMVEPASGDKLAKLHRSVGVTALRAHYTGPALCGVLAYALGIARSPAPARPSDLIADFAWSRVRCQDVLVRWDGQRLELG